MTKPDELTCQFHFRDHTVELAAQSIGGNPGFTWEGIAADLELSPIETAHLLQYLRNRGPVDFETDRHSMMRAVSRHIEEALAGAFPVQ